MDPWLESHWGHLHHSIIQYGCELIAEQLPPALFATVYVVEADEESSRVRPDVAVFETERDLDDPVRQIGGTLAVAEPVRMKVAEEPATLGHIEIRRLDDQEPLVTAIEVISPTNKLDIRNRRKYVNKREAYYAARVNVVEIDLLRAGEPLIDVPWHRLPPELLTPYKACIRRVPAPDTDQEVEYYPLRLRARLPRLRIPLRHGDTDVILDLQKPIEKAYAVGRFGRRLNYASPPPGPPLADAAWVADILKRRST